MILAVRQNLIAGSGEVLRVVLRCDGLHERLPLCTCVVCTIDVLEDSTVNTHTVQGAEAEVVRTNPRRGGQATSVAHLPGLGGVIFAAEPFGRPIPR